MPRRSGIETASTWLPLPPLPPSPNVLVLAPAVHAMSHLGLLGQHASFNCSHIHSLTCIYVGLGRCRRTQLSTQFYHATLCHPRGTWRKPSQACNRAYSHQAYSHATTKGLATAVKTTPSIQQMILAAAATQVKFHTAMLLNANIRRILAATVTCASSDVISASCW